MSKKSTRWPIWRIGVATGGCAVAAAVLFWASVFLEQVGAADEEATKRTLLTLPGFVLILGVVATMLTILCAIWLGARVRESRIPPWERGKKKSRRRR